MAFILISLYAYRYYELKLFYFKSLTPLSQNPQLINNVLVYFYLGLRIASYGKTYRINQAQADKLSSTQEICRY